METTNCHKSSLMNSGRYEVPFKRPAKLLGSQNAKTSKGEKLGYTTYILYLAPSTQNALNIDLCRFASEGCRLGCLYSAGRGKFSNVIAGRMNKTHYLLQDREGFISQLKSEIAKIEAKHKKANDPYFSIRLNGTSDLSWSTVIKAFPDVQFYDYTKNLNRALNNRLPNYHLTFSASESNQLQVIKAISGGLNVAIVTSFDIDFSHSMRGIPAVFKQWKGLNLVSADYTDLRFLDPERSICILKAKGEAKNDRSGFVYHSLEQMERDLF